MSEPMSDEQLAALCRIFKSVIDDINDSDRPLSGMRITAAVEQYVPPLLDEVMRLRTENAGMREIVHAVSDDPLAHNDWGYYCTFCETWESDDGSGVRHTPGCVVLKARALAERMPFAQ